MATKNRINLLLDGKLVYTRSTTREYAWALVGISKIGSGTETKLGITNCGNDRAALERIQLKARTSWRPRHLVLVPIVNREARITSAELEAPAAKPAAARDPRIGELMREGRTVYYATIDGDTVECSSAAVLADELRRYDEAGEREQALAEAIAEDEREPDYGGATDCMGNVFSDADPGL